MTGSKYAWLRDRVRDGGSVATGNRRLARLLRDEYGRLEMADGKLAWRTPSISSVADCVASLLDDAAAGAAVPTRLGEQQSRILWERILRRQLDDDLVNISALVRQSRDTWAALRAWNLAPDDCTATARGPDQRLFARAAASYAAILDREGWIDDAMAPAVAARLIGEGAVDVPAKLVLAGFDRITPQTALLIDALRAAGTAVERLAPDTAPAEPSIVAADDPDAELRAAGHWARSALEAAPHSDVGIVVTGLERDAQRSLRLLREGATPGWQWVGDGGAAVNVSYGRRLSDYPLIAIAAIILRWLVQPLDTRDVSVLLRSRCIGAGPVAGRARLELRLRELPDQEWRPDLVHRALASVDDSPDAADWLERLRRYAATRRETPAAAAPSGWAALYDEILAAWGWPGDVPLDSDAFQLVNRWRDALNELARLDLVAATLARDEAVRRLLGMLPEIVFQPESVSPVINVIGPLEAAGMRFDRLWVTGLTAAAWPPPGRPLPLLSRELQRDHGMPDSTPSDTSRYARTVVERLLRSAPEVVASYPRLDDGAEQVPTGLLGRAVLSDPGGMADPGWAGASQAGIHRLEEIGDERVPGVAADERIHGGASTLNNQLVDPFTAFAGGRLGIRRLVPIVHGLSPGLRGSAIHDALRRLFADVRCGEELRQWDAAECRRRASDAAHGAMARYSGIADTALSRLVDLEAARMTRLLEGVIAYDVEREPFEIEALECAVDACIAGVRLSLRIDRIDRLADGSLLVLDYKTGARKRFLDRDGDPYDMQLVVYASALGGHVAALGLYNVDSREIGIDGAGRGLRELEDWQRSLGGWQAIVRSAAERFASGDVRINARTGPGEARALNLLSRYTELVDDA